MTRLSEQPAKKIQPVLRPGERPLAAAQYEHPSTENWTRSLYAKFAQSLGLDPSEDLAHRQPEYGYLGVTDQRLILARSPWFGSVHAKHIYADPPAEDCRLSWYDGDGAFGLRFRMLLFLLPDDRFASVSVRTRWAGMVGKGQEEALVSLVEDVVRAFGHRATMSDEPR